MTSDVLALVSRPSLEVPGDSDAPPWRFVDPRGAHLSPLDLAATRGDGIFETVSVGNGRPQALEHHLSRFAHSARMLDLPAPDLDVWRGVVLAAVEHLATEEEAFVKTIMSRGLEYGGSGPTGWAYAALSPDFTRERTEGLRVVLLDRGYPHDVEVHPWLLAGAKTLSYAVNRAATREAVRRGADEAVFVSSDGIVLEGPTSTVFYRRGDTLLSPGTGLGILDGTTLANVFRWARSRGWDTGYELTTPELLRTADAAWLVSSVRLATPMRALDGEPLTVDVETTAEINAWLRAISE